MENYKEFQRTIIAIDSETPCTLEKLLEEINAVVSVHRLNDVKIFLVADDSYAYLQVVGMKPKTQKEIERDKERLLRQQKSAAEDRERIELEEKRLYLKLREKYENKA